MTKKPAKQRLDPDDVIAGRGRPLLARELIELIRDVNPTGRDLPAKEVARRYAQKSRLQSVLIRRFADDLEVAPDPDEPGVVSVRHRPLDTSACHALVSELDEDARSWVQRELDLEASGEAPVPVAPRRAERREARPPGEPAAPLDAANLLRAGQDAVDAYDYELARTLFLQALERPDADADVAVALLALFVDQLAADQEALGLEDRLPAPVRSRPEVRQLLALAAARSGDRGRALRLLKAPHGARVVEVFVALARAAIEAGDLAAAAADVAEVRARAAAHPELPGLAQRLAEHRAAERQPKEAELGRFFEEGRLDEAEACGRSILGRWPDSEVGRRAMRAIEELRRGAAAKRLVADADEALARGELRHARVLFDQARAAAAPSELTTPLQRRLDDAEEAERAHAERAVVEKVVALLGGTDLDAALLAYLALAPRQQALVQERAPLPQLGWLAEIVAPPISGARARAAVQAVAALERASAIVAAEPQVALDLLAAQGKILHGVGRGVEITREASARLDVLRREVACRRLDAARAAFEEGDVARAEALLEDVIAGDLPERERALAEEIEGRVARACEQKRLASEFEKRRRDGELIAARDLARSLADRSDGEEKARWAAIREGLEVEIGRAFWLHVDITVVPFTSLRELDLAATAGVRHMLLPGGRELLLVQPRGLWVFLRVIDLASRTIRARVRLRTPQPIGLTLIEVWSNRVLLFGERGAVLVLDLAAWTVHRWAERIGVVSPEESFSTIVRMPGTALMWVTIRPDTGRSWIVRVVDLTSGRIVRELREAVAHVGLRPVPGLVEPLMAVVTYREDALYLYDARGQLLERGKYALSTVPEAIIAAPTGDRLFVLTGSRRALDMRRRTPSRWCTLVPGRAASPSLSLESFGDIAVTTAMDPDEGLIYLRCEGIDSASQLLGVRLTASEPPALEVSFHAHLPGRNMLFEAWGGGPVTAIASHEDGFEIATLGAAAPDLRPGPLAGRLRVGALVGFATWCHHPSGARGAAIQALGATLKSEPQAIWRRRIATARQENNVDRLLALGLAFRHIHEETNAGMVLSWTLSQFPDHPEIRVQQARLAANRWQWAETYKHLAGVDLSPLDDARAQHAYHVLGAALLFLGRHAEALPLLRRGAALVEGRCNLEGLLALAIPLAEEASAPEAASWSPDQVFLREITRAVTTADACIAAGDAAGALRALDCLAVAEANEVQSLARRAEATLLRGEAGEDQRFETAFALASFCGAHADKSLLHRLELPLPCGIWDEARLDALAERASRWLDATLGEAGPMPAGRL